MSGDQLIDHQVRIDELGQAVANPILDFYKNPGDVPEGLRVFAALNALASVAGMVLAGAGMDPRALQFFSQAVVQQAVNQLTDPDEPEPSIN